MLRVLWKVFTLLCFYYAVFLHFMKRFVLYPPWFSIEEKNEKHSTSTNQFLYLQICCRNSKRRRFPKIRKLMYFIIYARRVIFLSSFYLLSLVVFLAYIDVIFLMLVSVSLSMRICATHAFSFVLLSFILNFRFIFCKCHF